MCASLSDGWGHDFLPDPSQRNAEMNNGKSFLGDAGDWAGLGALVIALLLGFHVVRGRQWTQAHNLLAGAGTALFVISRLD